MSTPTIARSASGSQRASGGPVWGWTFPGAPICINLTRTLVARLQSDVDSRTRSQVDSARELGGILFGHQRGNESIVDIDDYVWLPSEPSRDGEYGLNIAELERLRAERAADSPAVVGYFRTDFGANLELRDAEIDLISEQFCGATNVVLLICSSRPHTGGFFFWMGEGVMSPFSLMDFPLDVARLPFHDDLDPAVPPGFTAPVTEMPAIEEPPAEPEADLVRWPVLDPAPGRDPGAGKTPPAAVVQMPARTAPAPPPPVISLAQPPAEKTTPSSPQEATGRTDEAAGRAEENTLRETAARKKADRTNESPSRAKGIWLGIAWTLALLIGICLSAGVIVIAFRGGPPTFTTPAAVVEQKPAAPASPFELNVEAQGSGLNIRWNAQRAAVSEARDGQLTLSQANKPPVTIPLTAQQLTIGHIYFQSSAERLEVELQTTAASGGVSREAVLAVSSGPPAAAVPAPATLPTPTAGKSTATNIQQTGVAAPPVSQAPTRKVETIPIPNRSLGDVGEASAQNRPVARAFTAPANQTSVRMPVIDQPTASAAQSPFSSPVAINNGVLSARLAPPPPPPPPPAAAAPAPAAPQIAPQPVRVTSSLQAAKLLRRVSPAYPSVAIAGRVQGVMKFTATIAKDGTIGNLQIMSGPSVFAKPALDAVKQWTYRPTILNGQPVEVVTEIDVNFTLSQ